LAPTLVSGPTLPAKSQDGLAGAQPGSYPTAVASRRALASQFSLDDTSSNVVLFPKFTSIDANTAMLAGLPDAQRTGSRRRRGRDGSPLRHTARAARERRCRRAVRAGNPLRDRPTQAELNALVAAEKPVYDSLAADPSSAQVIEQIDALSRKRSTNARLPTSRRAR
jgi:hypothetical protein